MDTFDLYENFITPTEQTEIIAWAATVKEDCTDRDNLHSGGIGRRLSRTTGAFRVRPSIIDELRDRFETTLGLTDASRLRYKIVIHEMGADTANHVDAYSNEHPNFFRAALLVQAATQGGIFRVNNAPINFPELSLLSFVGDSSHGVTTIAQGERILLRANWFRP